MREAILDANAAAGLDTVEVPAGTFVLSGGMLQILDDLDLEGANARSTVVDGNALDRVFRVDAPGPVELSGLTIRNGFLSAGPGAGILNLSVSTELACSISENSAAGQGGGVRNVGELTIVDSTIEENYAGTSGGGVSHHAGILRIVDSTISGDAAALSGGGEKVGSKDAILPAPHPWRASPPSPERPPRRSRRSAGPAVKGQRSRCWCRRTRTHR